MYNPPNRRAALVRMAAAPAALAVAWPRLASAQGAGKLELATAYPASSFHVQNLERWAVELADPPAAGSAPRGSGAVGLKVHPAGSLIKAPEIRSAVQSGKVALGEVFGPSLASLHGVFGLDAIPFLATNYTVAAKLWKTVRAKAAAALEAQGLVLVFSVPWPPQGLFSAKPLASMSDVAGLRMRENSPPVKRLAELGGMKPVWVETPDLAAAAASGAIDLVFTSAAQGMDTKLYEKLPYFYETNAWLPRNVVLMHAATLAALPAAQRQAVLDSAQRAEERGWQASAAFARSTTEALAKLPGTKVAAPTPALRSRLERIGNQIGGEMLRAGDPELLSLTASFLI